MVIAKFDKLNLKYLTECIDTDAFKNSVSEIIIVWGSTHIQKFKELVQEFFNVKELCKAINLDESIKNGAAVQGIIYLEILKPKLLFLYVIPLFSVFIMLEEK